MKQSAEQGFITLIQEHMGILHKVVRLYAVHEEDKKDLYQEILYQSWKSFDSFNGSAKFSTWLYRVSLNTALTQRRKETTKPLHSSLEVATQVAAPTAAYSDEAQLLLDAVRQLPEVDRLLVSLHLDGYENAALADITGLSKNNVAVKLHRIKQELSKKLTAYEHGPA